jgi:hypothetical protein
MGPGDAVDAPGQNVAKPRDAPGENFAEPQDGPMGSGPVLVLSRAAKSFGAVHALLARSSTWTGQPGLEVNPEVEMNGMRDLAAVKAALRQHEIELPSWAFGNTGTRFKVFDQPGVPRTPWEKTDDAAQVHRFTGAAPSMAVHIPWDKVDDYAALARYAAERGIRIGTVNANVFQDDSFAPAGVAAWGWSCWM